MPNNGFAPNPIPNAAPNPSYTYTQPAAQPTYADYLNWMNQQRQAQMQAMQQQQAMQIRGHIVNSENDITVKDVSMDGYSFFPQNDESCIYVKYWTNNGINTRRYVPEPTPEEVRQDQQTNFNTAVSGALTDIINRLDRLEKSIAKPARRKETAEDVQQS